MVLKRILKLGLARYFLGLVLFGFGGLIFLSPGIPGSKAQEVEYLFETSSEKSLYQQILEKGGINLVQPEYQIEENIFPGIPQTQIGGSNVGALQPGEKYQFFLSEEKDALSFKLKIFSRPEFEGEPFSRFTLTQPDGTQKLYFGISEFTLSKPQPGQYFFTLNSSGIGLYDLTVESLAWGLKDGTSSHLLIEPEMVLKEEQLEQIDDFVVKGRSLIVVSNDQAAQPYGVYFTNWKLERDLSPEELALGLEVLRGKSIDLVENEPPPSNCFDLSHFAIQEGSLLKRFYCLNGEGKLYTLAFVSKDLFKSALQTSLIAGLKAPSAFSRSLVEIGKVEQFNFKDFLSQKAGIIPLITLGLLVLVLLFLFPQPIRFFLRETPGTEREKRDFRGWLNKVKLGWLNKIKEKIRLFKEKARLYPLLFFIIFLLGIAGLVLLGYLGYLGYYFLVQFNVSSFAEFLVQKKGLIILVSGVLSLILGLFFLFLLWIFPERPRDYWNLIKQKGLGLSRKLSLKPKIYLFFGFIFAGIFFLCDFFFIQKYAGWVFLLALFLGILSYFAFLETPLVFTPQEKIVFKFSQVLIIALPVFLVLSLVAPKLSFSQEQTYTLKAVEGKGEGIALANISGQNFSDSAQIIPGNSLLITQPFLISLDLPFSAQNRKIDLKAELKGNSFLSLQVFNLPEEEKTQPLLFFTPLLSDFKRIKSFASADIYRNKTSPLIEEEEKSENWVDFIKNNLPQDSYVGIELSSYEINPVEFLIESLEGISPIESVEFSSQLKLGQYQFYTYLTGELDLEIILQAEQKEEGKFVLEDRTGAIVYREKFEIPASLGDKAALKFKKTGLGIGLYKFYFTLVKGTEFLGENEEVSVKQIKINSSKLVLKTKEIKSQGGDVLYFRNGGSSLNYSSSLIDRSFARLGGSLKSPQGQKWDDLNKSGSLEKGLFKIYLPPLPGELSTSDEFFYSFSEGSWFNPFQFFFTGISEINDYKVIGNYPGSVFEEEGWVLAEKEFSELPKGNQVVFQIDFDQKKADNWLLLKEIEATVTKQ